MKYIIRDQECGYLLKNGRFIKLLMAGSYLFYKILGYEVLTVPMSGKVETCGIPMDVLMQDAVFQANTVRVKVPDECLALRFMNTAYKEVVLEREAVYWNVYEKNEFQLINILHTEMEEVLPRIYLDLIPKNLYKMFMIKDGEVGLLYRDNRLEKKLSEGTYYYWNYGREVTCKIFNIKRQQLEINGQEILTADKVMIRLNMVLGYCITDPERLVKLTEGITTQLYTAVQLLVRDYVGRYKLDELLAKKEETSRHILVLLKEKEEEFCVEILYAGIKDIILPGEVRDIMNMVLIAEKKAQANVITRREEVASTRSLLNTARLMDENRTLFQLKEMEYLEKICDKVGSITIHGGKGVLEQLAELAGVQKQE